MEYQQISCSLYDRIESLAVKKNNVEISFITDSNEISNVSGTINNVFSENKAEFLTINEQKIRLDKIKTITEL